jgi:hypothetical protein
MNGAFALRKGAPEERRGVRPRSTGPCVARMVMDLAASRARATFAPPTRSYPVLADMRGPVRA